MCTVCLGMFTPPLCVIDGLCSVILALPGHRLYHYPRKVTITRHSLPDASKEEGMRNRQLQDTLVELQ